VTIEVADPAGKVSRSAEATATQLVRQARRKQRRRREARAEAAATAAAAEAAAETAQSDEIAANAARSEAIFEACAEEGPPGSGAYAECVTGSAPTGIQPDDPPIGEVGCPPGYHPDPVTQEDCIPD
jgi:hypothetical protein